MNRRVTDRDNMCILCLSDEVFIERIFNNSNYSIYDWHKHTVFIAHSIYWFIRQACQSRSQISSIISVFEPPPFKKKNTQNLKKKNPAQHPLPPFGRNVHVHL